LLCRSDAHRFLLPCPAPLLLCRGRRYSSFRPSVTYFSRLFLFFFFFFGHTSTSLFQLTISHTLPLTLPLPLPSPVPS